MQITASTAAITAIWDSLSATLCKTRQRSTGRARADLPAILRGAAATGSTGVLEAETVCLAAGIGVPTPSVYDTLALFDATPRHLYRRPGEDAEMLVADERVAAADLAHLMMQVERLGFAIDPAPLCEALLPSLRSKAFLTSAEVGVFWHARERHRCEPLEVATGKGLAWGEPAETLLTAAGYRAEMHRDASGAAAAMKVTAPRWDPDPS